MKETTWKKPTWKKMHVSMWNLSSVYIIYLTGDTGNLSPTSLASPLSGTLKGPGGRVNPRSRGEERCRRNTKTSGCHEMKWNGQHKIESAGKLLWRPYAPVEVKRDKWSKYITYTQEKIIGHTLLLKRFSIKVESNFRLLWFALLRFVIQWRKKSRATFSTNRK